MDRGRRNRLKTRLRKGALAGALSAVLGLASACGGLWPSDASFEDTITVRPRVALDGLIELSSRTDGRLFVDEVVFHAPSVQIQDGPSPIADLLATDPDGADPVFFRYSLAEGGSGAIASERRWHLMAHASEAAEVSFGFSPFSPSRAELDEVLARTGWDLRALAGYTAYVHGFVSVAPADTTLAETKVSFRHDEQRRAGDAEGDPARERDGERLAGDAEGDPARGRDGERLAGDAEGDPARERGEQMAGDAEGDPAREHGERMAGDAEGDPAETLGQKAAAFDDHSQRQDGLVPRPGAGNDGTLVPFLLVFDGSAALGVPLAELGLMDLDADEFLPIDLHVDVNALLPDHRLEHLDVEAAEVMSGASSAAMAVLEVDSRELSRSFVLNLDAAQKRKPSEEKPRLQLTGDLRR